MDEIKKRKLEEIGDGQFLHNFGDDGGYSAVDELRGVLEGFPKPQLVDILARAGSQYPSIAEEIRSVASADPALRKLFVRGLAWNTTTESLCAAFEEHGEVEEGAVIYDKQTGKSRGYGFLTYKDMESAQRALKAPSKMIDGRMAVCNLASEGLSSSSNTSDQSQRKLYIGGLSPETTTEMLLNCFGRYGEIEEGSVTYDKETNKSRGFGFVTYKNVELANRALDDPQIIIGGRKITVKLADNYRAKASQMPSSAVPLPPQMPGGYPPMGSGFPMGYGYPQSMFPYYTGSYSSPTSGTAAPYPQMPYPYAQYPVKRDGASPQGSHGGYHPYYMSK